MRSFIRSFIFPFLLCIVSSSLVPAKTSLKDLPPRYRTWLQDEVNYIITNEEKAAFLELVNDEQRDKFIEHFWELRSPTPGAPDNAYKTEIYRRIEYAKQYLDGVHSAMGQVYITLGEPKQRAKYYGRMDVRPMEIWFFENANPALPPYFYVLFFDRDNTGTMRLYSPYMDGPSKLATSVLTVNDNVHSFQAIDKSLGREVARTTLSLLPDAPVDMQNATASLESDVMLGIIKNLANHPLTKHDLEQRRLAQLVTSRIVLTEEFLDVVATPFRDSLGNFNLHYLLRLHRPSDFVIGQAEGKTFYNVEFSARVYGPDSKLIFKQEKHLAKNLEAAEPERIKKSLFGYEGWLALAPGKYKIAFQLTNQLNQTGYKAEREVVIPAPAGNGLRLSDVLAFSSAEATTQDYLPFALGSVKFTPVVGNGLTFAPGENVNVVYQIWGPEEDPGTYRGKSLTLDHVYGRLGATGDARTIHDVVAKEQFDSFGSLVSGKKIPLAYDAAPGNYRLLISASDTDSEQKVYSSLNFRISSSPQVSPAYDVYDPDLADEVTKGMPEFDRALCSLAQGDKDSALKWFKTALARDSSNEAARSHLAELYFSRQDYADVADLFARAPVTNETDDQAILQAAEGMAKTGDVPRAISFLEKAVRIRSTSGPLYIALASYYRDEGNLQKANQLESKGRELLKE